MFVIWVISNQWSGFRKGDLISDLLQTQLTLWRLLWSFSFHMEQCIFSFLDPLSFQFKLNWVATMSVKRDLSSDTLFWIFWPTLTELHSQKKVTFSGTIHCQFLCLPTTLWRLICPFPKKLASHNSIQKKDDKVGNKTANKDERQRKRRERERNIEIDLQKKSKFWPVRLHEKQKICLIMPD